MSVFTWGESKLYERLLESTDEARLAYFRTLGTPDPEVWFPLISPMVRGGPAWPTRPAWQYIREAGQTIVASSGLSNPFGDADAPNLGFGVEIAVASADPNPAWLLDIAQVISHKAAADGRFNLRHERFGVFLISQQWETTDLAGCCDDSGTIGFLVGVPVPGASTSISLPAGAATLLMTKLLTPQEFAFVAERGPEGATRLVELFSADGSHHLSSPNRRSVV